MDPELQKRIEAAKAQGFTDEEIQQALGNDAGKSAQPEATMPGGYNVPILSAEEKARFNRSQQQVESANNTENFETGAVALGMGAAALGVPAALYYGGKAILNPAVRAGADLAQRGVGAMEQQAKTAAETESRMQRRTGFGGSGKVGPVAPTPGAYAGATPTTAVGPVSPAGMAPVQASPSIMDRMRALAANKVLQGAGNLARGSVGPGMAMYSGGLNTNEEEELRRRRMMPPTITR